MTFPIFHLVVTLGFFSDTYQFMERDPVVFVVQYLGQIDSNITFGVDSDGLINSVSTVEAGTTSKNITFNITGFDDDIPLEPDEVFHVTLSLLEPNSRVVITKSVTTVTIADDDGEL